MIDPDSWEASGEHVPEVVTVTVDDDGNCYVTLEMENGDVIHVGDSGGMSADYLDDLFTAYGDEMWEFLADVMYDEVYA